MELLAGAVYEAMNHIAVHKLPVLFVVEDNEIAQTTPQTRVRSGSIENRFSAFEIKTMNFDFLGDQRLPWNASKT